MHDNCGMNITVSYAADDTGSIIDQCNLDTSAITSYSFTPVVIRGGARGVED